MKQRLLMMLSVFMAITSVGWLHAAETTGTISSELLKAQTGHEVVFGITTRKGNVPDNTMVRVALKAKDNAFDSWKSYYYEPNGNTPGWVEWNPENDGFGPTGGFPFQDATSYIKVIPAKAGTYEYTLTVTAVEGNAVLLTKTQTLVVTDGPVTPMAKIGTTDYASLGTAVHFAQEGETIQLTTGHFNLVPGTEKIAAGSGEAGWYLPITRKGLTIEGVKGEGENATFVQSDVETQNGVWSSQNMITVFAEGVTLKNMIIDCKKEVNKAIEVVAKNFKMSNVQVGIFGEDASGFGGSVYFNTSDVGNVTIENSQLVKSRITFTGAQSGNVTLNKVGISYDNVVVEGTDMAELQQYGPFGATTGKTGLKITATDLNVFMSAVDKTYKLDANTIANLPAGATLNLKAGTYTADLTLDKAITINGAGSDESGTKIVGKMNITATDKAKVELSGLHLTPDNIDNHAIVVGTSQGQQNPVISLIGCRISKSNRGINILGKGAEVSLDNPDIDAHYYGVSLCNEQQKLSINGGTVQGWAAIMTSAGGLDTDKQTGKLASTGTVISVSKSKLVSKLISNENYGVVVLQEKYNGVTLTIDNSELVAMPNQSLELKYSSVLDIRSYGNKVAVTNSKLSCEGAMNEAGGGVVSLGWNRADFGLDTGEFYLVKDYSVPTSNTITISSSEVKMKAGEKSVITQRIIKNQPLDKLSINGVNYSVQAGNVYRSYQLGFVNKDWVMVDDNKNPLASDAASLEKLLESATNGSTITLLPGVYQFGKQLTIDKEITLAGTDTTTVFEATEPWTGSSNAEKYLLNITADNVSLKNLVVRKSKLGGINVFEAKNVKLSNVISRNNAGGGMVVNSSQVAIDNFKTSGNGWQYGINVDKGSKPSEGAPEPVLTIGEGCVFGEAIAVKSDLADAPSSYVVGSGWVQLKKGEGDKEYMVWANAASSGINIAITSVPAKVVYGQAALPLIANVAEATIEITKGAIEGVVALKEVEGGVDSLEIKKPGEAVLTIKANDMVVTQTLTVLKKTLTVTGITATNKNYNGNTEVTLVTKDMVVKGLVGDDQSADVLNTPTGVLTSADAGDAVPVKVTATFKEGKADYYELAPITGVTDTVKKVALTIKAQKPAAVNYGQVNPAAFTATTSGWVNSETEAALSGKLQFDCPATNSSLAGKYPVMPYGYTSQNYAITYTADSLEVKAIAPTVELVSATIGADKTSATVKGRVTSNGGTKTTDLKGDFKVGGTAKGLSLVVDKDGNFSTTLTELASTSQSIAAVAAKGDLSGTSDAMTVNLSLDLQNVAFVSELSRLVYGSSATVGAKGFAEGANVVFSSSDASILSIKDSIQVKANKAGTATITVTATLAGYITAIAKQTVTVEPKALTVAVSSLNKTYDGTTAVSPTYTLNGVLDDDKSNVSVSSNAVTANYLDKNASATSKTVVLSGALTLSGTAAGNYSLAQPSNLKGIISKAGQVTVTVANATRKYNEQALRYDLTATGLVDGETLATPNLYTGVISVSESGGQAVVSLNNVSFANYSSVKAENSAVTVVKGTPRVLTLSGATEEADVEGIVIDNEGWETSAIEIKEDEGSQFYAQVTYGDNQIARGASIQKKAAPVIDAAAWEWETLQTKAFALRAGATTQTLTYGGASTFNKMEGFTFETSNPAVITLSDGADDKKQVNAVGVGKAAILATNNEGGVTYLEVTVTPALLEVTTNVPAKVYDGTNLANPQVALTKENSDGVYIDLKDVQFTYASKDVGTDVVINSSKPLVLTGEKSANYTINAPVLKGKITARNLTVNGPVSKYYDGTAKEILTNYSAEGLISGEEVPVTATFTDAAVGTNKEVTLSTASKNYEIAEASVKTGSIVKSTIDVTLNEEASAATANAVVKDATVRETGKQVKVATIKLQPVIVTEVSGGNTVYYVSGGDTENYTVVYASNQIGFKAEEGGGDSGDDTTVSGITLDKTELMLARLETYTLKATLEPSAITGKTISWTSSDDKIATVDANGNVTAVALGEATITATVDGKSATCKVTVTAATALEEAIANTRVYGKDGSICIEPQMPMDVMVVNMVGQPIYKGHIEGASQIAVSTSGIYIVKLGTGGESKVHKVSVK